MTELSREDSASLAEGLRRALQEQYAFASGRKQDLAAAPEHRSSAFSLLTGLGLNGLLLPDVYDGVGGGAVDLQLVQRELGRALVVAPWFESVLCGQALLQAGTPEQKGEFLPALASGELTMAFALESAAGLDGNLEPTSAHQGESGWRISGSRNNVFHAAAVDKLIVSASVGKSASALFLVSSHQAGVSHSSYRLVDGSWTSDLVFEDAQAELLGQSGAPDHSSIKRAISFLANAGRCAEAFGAAEAALETTVQYLQTRKQFGQSLGEYQALRHRVAEMYIALEQARSSMELAVEATQIEIHAHAVHRAAQAQLVSSESVTWILQQAIQLHGGMGMTEELAVGHYYRRMLVLNAVSGGAVSALRGLVQAEG